MGIPEMINGKHIADLMEEVPIYIKPVSTVGAYNASKNEIWIDPHVPKELYPDIIEHERLHWLDRNFNKDNQRYKQDYEFLDFENSDANYLTHKIEQIAENDFRDMSEFSPRIVQIKQYKQISDPDYKWKDGELEQAWKEYSTYLKSFDIDNISQHTKTIKDWNKAGNWSDKAVPVLIPLTLPILKQNNGKYQE